MKYRKFFIIMLFLVLCGSFMSLLSPVMLNIWMSDEVGFTSRRIAILLIILICSLILDLLFTWGREKFAKGFNISNCQSILSKYFQLSYDKINEEGPTNLIERIGQAVNNIYFFMTGDFIKIWSSIIIMIAVLVMLGYQNIFVAIGMIMMIPINYLGYRALNKELSNRSLKLQEDSAIGWQQIISVVGQTDYLKQSDSYNNILYQLKPTLDKIYSSMADVNVFAKCASKLLSSINNIVQIMIMVLAVYQFISKESSPVTLILYSILLPLYFSNLSTITNANLSKQDMIVSNDFLKELDKNRESDGIKSIETIDTIDFSIDHLVINNTHLASNINGHFEKGDVVWVQGASGTGKSTLMKLIPKFRMTNTIYFNGEDIRNITNSSVRNRINYLAQSVPIINGTLRDNIFFNKQYDKNIEEKLISDPILKTIFRDKNFDTQISDGGSNLSGGEKQKIAFARALYDEVDVMILDEITSNIDKESANEIMNRLIEDKCNRITFIISHDDLPKNYSNKILLLNQ